MAKMKLSKEFVQSAKPTSKINNGKLVLKEEIYWDSRLSGFGLKVTTTGHKSYILQYRNQTNRSKRLTLGNADVLTLAQTKDRVKKLLGQIANGVDPQLEKKQEREKQIVTGKDMLDAYVEHCLDPELEAGDLKQEGVDQFKMCRRKYLDQKFGSRDLKSVNRATLNEYHREMTKKFGYPTAADTAIMIFLRAWNYVAGPLEADIPPAPNMNKFKWNGGKKHTTVLEPSELALFTKFMTNLRSKTPNNYQAQREVPTTRAVLDYIEYVLWTGVRSKEAEVLTWPQCNFHTEIIESTDKVQSSKTVPMTSTVKSLLLDIKSAQKAEGIETDYVFPSYNSYPMYSEPVDSKTILRNFHSFVEQAGIKKWVNIHDLRRTYITHGRKTLRLTDDEMSKLMSQTTAIQDKYYSGQDNETERRAADQIAASYTVFMNIG